MRSPMLQRINPIRRTHKLAGVTALLVVPALLCTIDSLADVLADRLPGIVIVFLVIVAVVALRKIWDRL